MLASGRVYDFLMLLGLLCLLGGAGFLVMFFVRLTQERPAKRHLLGVLGTGFLELPTHSIYRSAKLY